ncbi:MAG: winged helix-turn-helix transcriptional regulator [Candidatus Thorarchaeota archaeon]
MKVMDSKDLKILEILDDLGPRTSTLVLQERVGIPARTIRYRIRKMMENGILSSTFPLIDDRRLGLDSQIVVIKPTKTAHNNVKKLLERDSSVPWFSSTYGKYDGYIAEFTYAVTSRNANPTLLESLKKQGHVQTSYLFDIVDYEFKKADFASFDANRGWNWNWEEWITMKSTAFHQKLNLEKDFPLTSYDSKDIAILKMMLDTPGISYRKLAEVISISKTDVNNRIHRLEHEGVIKEYKFIFTPFDELLYVACFLQVDESSEEPLSKFYQLPFPAYIIKGAQKRYCIRLDLTLRDFKGFLRGLDQIKHGFSSVFIQLLHDPRQKPPSNIYNLLDEDTGTW